MLSTRSVVHPLCFAVIVLLLCCHGHVNALRRHLSSHPCTSHSVASTPPLDVVPVVHVHYVDSFTSHNVTNYLFRGGAPNFNPGNLSYNYPGLIYSIEQAANMVNLSLPTNYRILDLNLLNFQTAGDFRETVAAYQFWQDNPQLGSLLYWETWGTSDNISDPVWQTPPNKEQMVFQQWLWSQASQWLEDHIVQRVEQLKQMLTTIADDGVTTIIYGHCDCGCDRTGQMFGAYYMRWLGMSWEQMNALNGRIAGRPYGCEHYRMLQFYCLYLNEQFNSNLNCQHQLPCDNSK